MLCVHLSLSVSLRKTRRERERVCMCVCVFVCDFYMRELYQCTHTCGKVQDYTVFVFKSFNRTEHKQNRYFVKLEVLAGLKDRSFLSFFCSVFYTRTYKIQCYPHLLAKNMETALSSDCIVTAYHPHALITQLISTALEEIIYNTQSVALASHGNGQCDKD